MEKPGSKFVVYFHGNERKIGPFCDSHKSAVTLCQKMFPALAHAEVGFYAIVDDAEGYPVEICAEGWKDITASAHITKMVVVDQTSKLLEVVPSGPSFKAIDIKTMTGKTVSVKGIISVATLKERIQQFDGTPAHLQRFIFNGVEKADTYDLDPFSSWDTIQLWWKIKAL